MDEELERVACTDSTPPWRAFWRVMLPQPWRSGLGGAGVILAHHPKIVPVLVYKGFEGFGLGAAQPVWPFC